MNSCIATAPLVQAASRQERAQMHECSAEATTIRNDLKAQKRKCLKEKAEAVRNKASDNMKLAMDLAKEKGASSWLSVLPIDEFGFFLHKGAFRDAVSLRYGWQLPNLPRVCVCGKNQSVDHAFTCSTGGLPTLISWQKCATMSAQNRSYNPCLAKLCKADPLTVKTVPG